MTTTPNPIPDQVLTPLSEGAADARQRIVARSHGGVLSLGLTVDRLLFEQYEAAIRAPLEARIAALVSALAPLNGFWDSVEHVSKIMSRPYGRNEQISVPSLTYDECMAIRAALAGVPKEAGK